MSSRFFTVEDLYRAGSKEIVVDDDTVVTPQALEAARGAGIVIRSRVGDYNEPRPDRGPDAERALSILPQLPEPVDDELSSATGVVVTAVGKNRPGVLAEITAALSQTGVNIHDISQKMIEGYFHMILTVEVPPGVAFAQVKAGVECLGGPDDYVVRLMHERVFRFMHRI